MNLRTRITVIVATGFAVLLLVLGVAGILLEMNNDRRQSDILLNGHSVLIREILAVDAAALSQPMDRLDLGLIGNIVRRTADRSSLEAALSDAGFDFKTGQTSLEVIGPDQEIAFTIGDVPSHGILDAGSLDQAFRGKRLTGLRLVSGTQIFNVATRTLNVPGMGLVVVVVGRDFSAGIRHFAASIGGESAFVTMRGRLVAATQGALWEQSKGLISLRHAAVKSLTADGHTYVSTVVALEDLSGSGAGALVSFVDITRDKALSVQIRNYAIAGAVTLALLGVVSLNIVLGRSLHPLGGAINVLEALSRGDASVAVTHSGRDEIGRIGSSVNMLRESVRALGAARRQRQRVHKRQEAVIAKELRALAGALDHEDRQDVLALLEAEGDTSTDEGELRRVARLLRDLAQRIVAQHTRLAAMLLELREALVTKTAFAAIQQELEIAKQVQLAILPKVFPKDPRVQVHGEMTPAKEVGGDFYDFYMLNDHLLGFVVADVSGKGVPAAFFMAIARTMLRSTSMFEPTPAECVRRLNAMLAAENEQMLFVTLFYGTLDLRTGLVTYVNAGHNLPYRIGRGNQVTPLSDGGGIALAIVDDFEFPQHSFHLTAGETLFLFTDGVTEAFDIDSNPYGELRLENVLAEGAAAWSVQTLCERVRTSVHTFERGAPQADDITSLALRYWGAAGPAT